MPEMRTHRIPSVPFQCHARNKLITQLHEAIHNSEKIGADIVKLEAQVKRINRKKNESNIDPKEPLLVEFMESALFDQKTYLMRVLWMQHAKLVGIGALPLSYAFVASSSGTVVQLSAVHFRFGGIRAAAFASEARCYSACRTLPCCAPGEGISSLGCTPPGRKSNSPE